jgi:hypothetical protein
MIGVGSIRNHANRFENVCVYLVILIWHCFSSRSDIIFAHSYTQIIDGNNIAMSALRNTTLSQLFSWPWLYHVVPVNILINNWTFSTHNSSHSSPDRAYKRAFHLIDLDFIAIVALLVQIFLSSSYILRGYIATVLLLQPFMPLLSSHTDC